MWPIRDECSQVARCIADIHDFRPRYHLLDRLYGRVSLTFVEKALFDVGPKLLKSIGCQDSAEAFCAPQEGVVRIGLTVNAPGV
jgi:hypothetical protein